MTSAEARKRLEGLGLAPSAVGGSARALRGRRRPREGLARTVARVEWLETLDLDPAARPLLVESEEGFERWDGHGALGYLVLEEIVRATLDDPPERARVVVARRCFPTGVLGYWVTAPGRGWARRGADGDVAPSPPASGRRRSAHRDESARDRDPVERRADRSSRTSRWGRSRTATSWPGAAHPEELVPFGGEQAHKAFALAVGLRAPRLRARRARARRGARRRAAGSRPVPAFRELAAGRRLPGDSGG